MRQLGLTALAALMLVSAPIGGASAGNGHSGKNCPPGLAKKQNGCNPPGLVKHRYNVGDHIYDDYTRIKHPGRHGLKPGETYYRVGDYVYRVDRETRKVLDLVGAVVNVLN